MTREASWIAREWHQPYPEGEYEPSDSWAGTKVLSHGEDWSSCVVLSVKVWPKKFSERPPKPYNFSASVFFNEERVTFIDKGRCKSLLDVQRQAENHPDLKAAVAEALKRAYSPQRAHCVYREEDGRLLPWATTFDTNWCHLTQGSYVVVSRILSHGSGVSRTEVGRTGSGFSASTGRPRSRKSESVVGWRMSSTYWDLGVEPDTQEEKPLPMTPYLFSVAPDDYRDLVIEGRRHRAHVLHLCVDREKSAETLKAEVESDWAKLSYRPEFVILSGKRKSFHEGDAVYTWDGRLFDIDTPKLSGLGRALGFVDIRKMCLKPDLSLDLTDSTFYGHVCFDGVLPRNGDMSQVLWSAESALRWMREQKRGYEAQGRQDLSFWLETRRIDEGSVLTTFAEVTDIRPTSWELLRNDSV